MHFQHVKNEDNEKALESVEFMAVRHHIRHIEQDTDDEAMKIAETEVETKITEVTGSKMVALSQLSNDAKDIMRSSTIDFSISMNPLGETFERILQITVEDFKAKIEGQRPSRQKVSRGQMNCRKRA